MGVLSRHFVARFLSTFAFSIVILTLAILTVETLTDLHVAVAATNGWADLLARTALRAAAYYLPYLIPIGALVAAFVRFGGAARRSEIVAAKAGGISPLQLALPILAAGLVLSGVSLVANEALSVPSRSALRQPERGDPSGLSYRQGAFWYADAAFVFRVESADEDRRALHGVTIFERDPSGRLVRRLRATRAEIVGRGRWQLHEAEILQIDPDRPAVAGDLATHPTLEIEIGDRRALLNANPDHLPLRDLFDYGSSAPQGSSQQLHVRSLIHERLSNPLATFPFVVLAVALGLRVERSRSLARSALPVVLAVFVFLLARRYAGMLARQGLLAAPWGTWGSLALFLAVAVDQLRRVPR